MAHGGTEFDRRRARILFVLIGLAVVLVDQVTKHLAVVSLEDEPPMRLLWGAVYLTLVRNSGAAFSLFTDYTFIFPVIAFAVVLGLVLVMRGVRSRPWAWALGLVLGGAVGNLGDRLFRAPGAFVGHVVDMVSVFDDRGQAFPVFNVADSALCVGVGLIILLELTGRRRDGTRVAPASGGEPGAGSGPADEAASEGGGRGGRDRRG